MTRKHIGGSDNSPQAAATPLERSAPIDPVLRRPAVRGMLGVSNSTLHVWIKNGRFPAPLELGPRVRGWRRSVVESYLSNCAKASTSNH
jgi:prophage regulatory protein